MRSKFCLLAFNKRLTQHFGNWPRVLVAIVLLLILNVGCAKERSPNVELKMQVQQSGSPGVYVVSGSTNLPEKSLITVAAMRSLRSSLASSASSKPNGTYSILARQIVRVEKGKWQSTLNLWQVAPDGWFQEAWELKQSEMEMSLDPAPEVIFLALLDPASQPPAIEQKLQQQGKKLAGRLIRFTSDGQWYVQASEILPVALPSGKTTPRPIRAEDKNWGWGDRFVVKQEPPVSSFVGLPPDTLNPTSAPLSQREFMR